MKTNLYSLIVISPDDPQIWKIRISGRAVAILAMAFVLSFCLTVALTERLQPGTVDQSHYRQLEEENRAMRVDNRNAQIRTQKVGRDLERLDQVTKRLTVLLEAD